jgi:hypothetical protein
MVFTSTTLTYELVSKKTETTSKIKVPKHPLGKLTESLNKNFDASHMSF